MKKTEKIKFKTGKNIAMKVPSHQYNQTVQFYRDIIGLPEIKQEDQQIICKFGDKNLWIDKEKHLSQAEIWLALECEDINEAEKYFKAKIEKLPGDFKGFWMTSPCNIIHLITVSQL